MFLDDGPVYVMDLTYLPTRHSDRDGCRLIPIEGVMLYEVGRKGNNHMPPVPNSVRLGCMSGDEI